MSDNNSSALVYVKDDCVIKINELRQKNNIPPISGQGIIRKIEDIVSKSFASAQK